MCSLGEKKPKCAGFLLRVFLLNLYLRFCETLIYSIWSYSTPTRGIYEVVLEHVERFQKLKMVSQENVIIRLLSRQNI